MVPWVLIFVIFFLCLFVTFEAPKFSVEIVRSRRSGCVWYAMTTWIKVWTLYLDRIMSTKSLLCKMKRPCEIVHIPSKIQLFEQWMQWHHTPHHACVHVCSLSCARFKSWMPNESIGFVHTQERRLAIEKWENLNKIQRIVAKIANGRQNMRMIHQALSHEAWTMKRGGFNEFQTPFRIECWCTHFKMESCKCWNDLPMNCSKGGNVQTEVGKRSWIANNYCWKTKSPLFIWAKALKRKGCWLGQTNNGPII